MSRGPIGALGPAGNNVRRNIRRLREERRWSYREVEERLARVGRVIPVLGLSAIDAGERRADVDDLVALAAVTLWLNQVCFVFALDLTTATTAATATSAPREALPS